MKTKLNILSLFDGISCGRVALELAGIEVGNYYASEIDKYAEQMSADKWSDIVRLGDVLNFEKWDIDWSSIDFVFAGFPCQAWSLAGKQLGDKDPRGALFWTMLDIIKKVKDHNPNVLFLMENVKMKKDFEEYITFHSERILGHVEKTLINSALVSAQNRNRFYWTNFKVDQPEDRGILLKDIIEDSSQLYRPCEPLKTPTAGGHVANATDIKGHDSIKRVYSPEGKAPTLTTMTGGHREPKVTTDNESLLYRKLTPLECERLQTLPDNYTLVIGENGKQLVSNSQRYKAIGNGWTAEVIAHILKCAYNKE